VFALVDEVLVGRTLQLIWKRRQRTIHMFAMYTVGHKRTPFYYCNNFVYCQPSFIIFSTLYYKKNLHHKGIWLAPPNMVCVTTLRPGEAQRIYAL